MWFRRIASIAASAFAVVPREMHPCIAACVALRCGQPFLIHCGCESIAQASGVKPLVVSSSAASKEHFAETEAQHAARPHDRAGCARCLWLANRSNWTQRLATLDPVSGQHVCYIVERPLSLVGLWALGCSACSHFAPARSMSDESLEAGGTAFARFEIRSVNMMQIRLFQRHYRMECHTRAVQRLGAVGTPQTCGGNVQALLGRCPVLRNLLGVS